jgi:hypothetical protein
MTLSSDATQAIILDTAGYQRDWKMASRVGLFCFQDCWVKVRAYSMKRFKCMLVLGVHQLSNDFCGCGKKRVALTSHTP